MYFTKLEKSKKKWMIQQIQSEQSGGSFFSVNNGMAIYQKVRFKRDRRSGRIRFCTFSKTSQEEGIAIGWYVDFTVVFTRYTSIILFFRMVCISAVWASSSKTKNLWELRCYISFGYLYKRSLKNIAIKIPLAATILIQINVFSGKFI